MRWNFLSDKTPTNLGEVKEIILQNRSISDVDAFLNPTHPSELSLADVGISETTLAVAVKRIQLAKSKKQKIVVFGDYDADGICASAIMWQTLYDLGFDATPFIPEREKHGYGITISALEDILADQKPDLIITVDNGIVAHEALEMAQQEGIDVIVTDHHQPEDVLPPAVAIVHTTQLCGTSVTWMVAREVVRAEKGDTVAKTFGYLDLCGIATIADQVPLRDANRSFAKHGLVDLAKTTNLGLQTLMRSADVSRSAMNSYTVGFVIAPRLNAMGRLAHAMDALRLLCTKSKSQANALATELTQTNAQRQDLTQAIFEDAIEQAREQKSERIIIVHSSTYHEGVIGLVAGRLSELFHKPAIAISVSETMAKASARSVLGVNVVELIRQVRADLLTVGGHPMAAGFGLEVEKLDKVIVDLQQLALEQIDENLLESSLDLECVLPLDLVSVELAEMVDELAPFGNGNEKPMFGIDNLVILGMQFMGKQNEHVKLMVGAEGMTSEDMSKALTVIGWRKAQWMQEVLVGDQVKIAGMVEINEWKGRKSVQIVMRSMVGSDVG